MTTNEFYRGFETVLEMPSGTIGGTESPADLADWDSMAKTSFIVIADGEFGAFVQLERLAARKTVHEHQEGLDKLDRRLLNRPAQPRSENCRSQDQPGVAVNGSAVGRKPAPLSMKIKPVCN